MDRTENLWGAVIIQSAGLPEKLQHAGHQRILLIIRKDEMGEYEDADKESMFFRKLSDVGEDWIRAVVHLTKGQDGRRMHAGLRNWDLSNARRT